MKRKKRKDLHPINWQPVYWFAEKVLPDYKDAPALHVGLFTLENLESRIEKMRQKLRKNYGRDDVDLMFVRIREVYLKFTCTRCNHSWEETHGFEIYEYTCPECHWFNSIKYEEGIRKEYGERMKQYKTWSVEQWMEYDKESSRSDTPSEPPVHHREIIFEQLELF